MQICTCTTRCIIILQFHMVSYFVTFMKSNIQISLGSLLLVLVSLMTACEVIPENDRLIPVELEESNRTTLIVEFSGLQCNNCPNAATMAHDLQEYYGEKLVVVEMHPASNSLTQAARPEWDYTCPESDEYYKHWQIPYLPFGVVNMSQQEEYQTWGTACQQSAMMISPVTLTQTVVADSTTLQIEASIDNLSYDNLSLEYIAWLTEDSIIGPQVMPNKKTNKEYAHNHILRDAITDTWGMPVTVEVGESSYISISYTLPSNVVAKNCNIVGIVMKDGTAIQVNEYKLKKIIE